MSTSLIGSVLVVAAALAVTSGGVSRRPLKPATIRAPRHRVAAPGRPGLLLAAADRGDDSILVDSLRTLGLVRRDVERPVVGPKAYVRWWERARAAAVLALVIIVLGLALAVAVGLVVFGLGFLLEQAIG